MRIGFAGNGSLGDQGATVRDGTVEDRWELFKGLEEAGVEVVYLGPPERSPGDTRAVGYRWTGPLDALVLEVRDAVWPPQVQCLVTQRPCDLEHAGVGPVSSYLECCDTAMGAGDGGRAGVAAYTQAVTIRNWYQGLLNPPDAAAMAGLAQPGTWRSRPPVLLWDFDLNVRRVIGVHGRSSTYTLGRFWRAATPWMGEALAAIKTDPRSTGLAPYEVGRAPWAKRRSKDGGSLAWETLRWTWPERLVVPVQDLAPMEARTFDMVYTGSDYDRRERWLHYYGAALQAGANIGVTGTWGDRRGGREDGALGEKGFRSRLTRWVGELRAYSDSQSDGIGPLSEVGLTFLSPTTTIQLPYIEAMRALSDARVSVQVVPKEYALLGYHTNRWSEIWARGTMGFIDPRINDVGDVVVPGYEGIVAQEDPERINIAWRKLRAGDGAMLRWYELCREEHRGFLRERYGRGPQARRLLDIIERAAARGA